VLIVRPIVGLVATIGLGFDLAQRIFIGAMAPRGIVAAATASLFAISLLKAGVNFPHLMPMVFMVIIFTVAIYGLSAPILARKLKISRPGKDTLAVMGDQPWITGLTNSLHKAGCSVMLVAHDKENVKRTRSEIPYVTYTGPLAELADEEIIDEAHEFKNRVEWLIIATDNPDLAKIVQDTFMRQLGYLSMIVLGRYRQKQDEVIFAKGGSDMLINTPFGLFGRNQDEILDSLDKGGFFDAIDASSQPADGGVPPGMKPFLRVLSNGKLAVPGDTSLLNEGEWLIVVRE
jgi:NhaP-type Na+/H+ and K+/H+ antiporters